MGHVRPGRGPGASERDSPCVGALRAALQGVCDERFVLPEQPLQVRERAERAARGQRLPMRRRRSEGPGPRRGRRGPAAAREEGRNVAEAGGHGDVRLLP